jgi:hypothetical protein
MKYLEGMEEDVAVRPGIGWTGINGEGLPTRRFLFTLRERERKKECFSWWFEVNG